MKMKLISPSTFTMSSLKTMFGALVLFIVTVGAALADDVSVFKVLAYNIYMRPTTLFSNQQAERASALPSRLHGFDVIVFSEAFDDDVRFRLLVALTPEYPFQTRILGSDRGFEQDGGVIIVSRWPITEEAQRLYGGVCVGDDCWADKGVLYARIDKHGQTYHIFASHTQAGNSTKRRQMRMVQLGIIRSFIDERGISNTEPVFIAGDLNVDKYNPDEYAAMLRILDAKYPQALGHPYTMDSTINPRADGRSYLDYVLVSNRHLQPEDATIETLLLRSPTPIGGNYDLSDHFPVFGRFTFFSPAYFYGWMTPTIGYLMK